MLRVDGEIISQAKNNNPVEKTVEESEKTDDNKIKELEDKMSQILEKMNSVQNQPVYELEKKDNSLDRDVLFISLCVGTLNLSTRKNGDGDIYTFTEFGEEQMIPYMDAKNIIKNNISTLINTFVSTSCANNFNIINN